MEQLPQVGFMKSFVLFWKNYVNFTGRSRRSEYWYMMLWHLIFILPAFFVFFMGAVFVGIGDEIDAKVLSMFGVMILILTIIYMLLYSLATFIPNLALSVRRFHDISRTMLFPMIMTVFSIIFYIVLQIIDSYYDSDFTLMPIGLNILLVLLYFVYLGLTIVMIVFLCFDSKPANKYGESPKYPSSIKNQPVTSETPEKAGTSETPKTPEETDNQL
ncbi:TPA: DUF805 domain-containing protein [Staphylococcus aureus]|uniref:DUF805 domain-containing protein n=1 Tax=Staphylococcus aureus TaxID=1280 RepID=UPI001C2739D7|nr:DUF805 domain-containing protein [Staphylococcus aureus]MBU9756624.1 DUF805 domain-containing protein [Staphylococcus aureus]MBU9802548.1 DUF805 domain-containing protein [Staphylococcus aureus]MCE4973172.1 DUF805 domain-containing protein [Staphylococcus aureus]MCM0466712.1 DUF805 domain-containing protein [Staphylococcus aureus]MCM0471842.1 DUF805 domain-containing protein [Staphylococcus aureus]